MLKIKMFSSLGVSLHVLDYELRKQIQMEGGLLAGGAVEDKKESPHDISLSTIGQRSTSSFSARGENDSEYSLDIYYVKFPKGDNDTSSKLRTTTKSLKSPTHKSSSRVRASPFRETEWDRRFNNLMDDLENSAAANMKTGSDDYAQSQNYSPQQHSLLSSSQHQSKSSSIINNNNSNSNTSNYLSSSSTSGLAPDNVLQDLNSALNASSNYIENHRTETGPGSMTEEKVQHMMPSSNLYSSSVNTGAASVTPKNGYSPLQSANMVSSLQQQNNGSGISSNNKTAFSSMSKVQKVFVLL
ncbi:unnamed protein product [Lepeophtheirus salmonis]|uniref:(salmon louse) hypothetical protein n=1 Tax=Lepeophtheirus salmonis TaxID=72036 RepID=A0A7R8CVT0_LEPSM|nr:unnamed protein product [Lepeophtheirus salmonis]CAF2947383.1 unnamed protein product [Lepeophtheirus salmonis]